MTMKLFKKNFSRRANKIAEYRCEYFNRFVGCRSEECPNGWYGYTPEEAMQLADKVTAWLYSPLRD